MTTLLRTTSFLFGIALTASPAAAQRPNTPSMPSMSTVTGPVLVRPEFTRPAGIPGSSRWIAAGNSQYLMAPAQPDQPSSKKRKRRN